ncbi:MAG TPA: hypothetical protein VNQ77_00120 [Frankiaceae bacterium]|nr:hypothetical protein [Frankiaceae bacterium]
MKRLAAVLVALALAGCAEPSSVGQEPTPTPTPTPAYAADDAVLRVEYRGGLLPRETVPDGPYWALYGDGRVVTRGPEPDIHPGQAMPNLRVAAVPAPTVTELVEAAREAGIDGVRRDYGDPPVADASTTVFVLRTEDGVVETAVYALAEHGDEGNEARRKLYDFHRRLTAEREDGGFGGRSSDEVYEPAAVAVFARPYTEHDDDGLAVDHREQELRWRGPDPATGEDTRAGRCTVVTGAALATVLPDLRRANTLTRWRYDGKDWALGLRPLFPDESTCADVLA